MTEILSFLAPIYLGTADKAARHFVTVDKNISDQIKILTADQPLRRGRKSIKVEATIGYMSRETSIFPNNESGTYILAVKKSIREEFNIGAGDEVRVGLKIL